MLLIQSSSEISALQALIWVNGHFLVCPDRKGYEVSPSGQLLMALPLRHPGKSRDPGRYRSAVPYSSWVPDLRGLLPLVPDDDEERDGAAARPLRPDTSGYKPLLVWYRLPHLRHSGESQNLLVITGVWLESVWILTFVRMTKMGAATIG